VNACSWGKLAQRVLKLPSQFVAGTRPAKIGLLYSFVNPQTATAFPTELKFIEAAERDLGVGLPASFRVYLLASNGGETKVLEDLWELNPVFDNTDRRHMAHTAGHIVSDTA